MSVIRELFITVCNMSVTAAFVIVMVLLARQLLKKVPRRFSYYLWLIVAFRLVCPYSIPTGISMFNLDFFQDRANAGSQVIWNLSEMLHDETGDQTAEPVDEAGGKVASAAAGERRNQEAGVDAESAGQGAVLAEGSAGNTGALGESAAVSSAEDMSKSGTAKENQMATNSSGAGKENQAASSSGTAKENQMATNQSGASKENQMAANPSGAGKGIFAWFMDIGSRTDILAVIWLAGGTFFLLFQFVTYLRLRKNVETAVRYGEGIYECDAIHTPFVMGFFSPKIYLPFRMEGKEYEYILLHEQYHIRRRDHQVKVIAVLILAVHWFNPLVWAAYHFMCKDMEMSCDEMVIGKLGSKVKEDYSRSLLGFAVKGRNFAAAPLSFGEVPVKTRIKNVLHFQNPRRAAILFGAAVCVIAAVIGIGNGRKREGIRYAGYHSTSEGGAKEFEREINYEYALPKEIKSYLLYKETYKNGVLEEYTQVAAREIGEEQKKGTISIESEIFRKADAENDAVFAFKLSGETDSVVDFSSLRAAGYDGVLENYYMENADGWAEIEPGEDMVIAAWNLMAEKSDGAESVACEEFMDSDLRWNALAKNDGEILYHLVFSEKSAPELEEDYAVSPHIKALYALKNRYIGDAVSDGKIIRALAVAPELSGTMELKTDREPYAQILHYEDTPENEIDFYHSMAQKATALLMLIGNADRVEWTYPVEEDGWVAERHFCWTCEQANHFLGVEDLRTFAGDEMALQTFFERDFRYAHPFYEALPEDEQGTTAPDGEVFLYEGTVIGKMPGDVYDSVYSVLSKEENPDMADVAAALQAGGSSESLYVRKEKCARTEEVQISENGDSDKRQGYLAENGTVYRYREVMTGRHPNAAADSAYVVYFDEPGITFQDITDYFFSSDSAKAFQTGMYVTPLEDSTEGQ